MNVCTYVCIYSVCMFMSSLYIKNGRKFCCTHTILSRAYTAFITAGWCGVNVCTHALGGRRGPARNMLLEIQSLQFCGRAGRTHTFDNLLETLSETPVRSAAPILLHMHACTTLLRRAITECFIRQQGVCTPACRKPTYPYSYQLWRVRHDVYATIVERHTPLVTLQRELKSPHVP